MDPLLLAPAFLLGALLYASVGHGGASAYLAIMALAHVAPESMRPLALALNLLVSAVATWQFARAGHFSWSLLWPFALASVPAAYLGGTVELPTAYFRFFIGAVLAYAAISLWLTPRGRADFVAQTPSRPWSLVIGGGLGFAAGLTGVGGGIFLSPLLLMRGWATTRTTAAVSAAFIWLNSAAGIIPQAARLPALSDTLLWAAPAVLVGGLAGSWIGARHAAPVVLRRLLAAVLALAAAKLLATALTTL